jgi:hypothetical protein
VSHVDEIKEALEIIDGAREIIAAKLSLLELMLETEEEEAARFFEREWEDFLREHPELDESA